MALYWKKRDYEGLLKKIAANDSSVTSLDLTLAIIGDDGVKALAKALRGNSLVACFVLTGNNISDEGAKALAEALHSNSTLTYLDLGGNNISDEGAKALVEALHSNSTLTHLCLTCNNISHKGANALALALLSNSTLTDLYLACNNISDEGAKALAEALHSNSTLTDLDLTSNNITDEGAKALAEALHSNSTLATLILHRNNTRDNGLKVKLGILTQINRDTSLTEKEKYIKKVVIGLKTLDNFVEKKKYGNINEYTGQWRKGKLFGGNYPEGEGMALYDDGDLYTGRFEGGVRNGQGKCTRTNGNTYTGQWKADKREGQGKHTWPDGQKYAGQWMADKMEGHGEYTWPDGRRYTGQFKDGMSEGQGVQTWPEGTKYRKYDGEWRADKMEGQGEYIYANGQKYIGEWKDGKKHGPGMYVDKRGWVFKEQYDGGQLTQRVSPTVLFLGNTGTGKSTIINTILGEVKAQAGVSEDGTGVTKSPCEYNISSGRLSHISITDMVGWENEETKAMGVKRLKDMLLGDNQQVKVVFVVTPEGGRVDRAPIQDFIKKVKEGDNKRVRFGVIVNKAETFSAQQRKSTEELLSYELDAEKVMFIEKLEYAHLKENVLLSEMRKDHIEQFIEDLPASHISWTNISDLREILLMADACSLIYFYADLLNKGSERLKQKLSQDTVTFQEVVSALEETPADQRDSSFQPNLKVLKQRCKENMEKEAMHQQSPGFCGTAFLSCVSQSGIDGGLVYTITVSPRAFKRIILTFRGSVTGQDWWQNAQLFQETVRDNGPTVDVHKGFHGYLDKKYEGIKGHLCVLQEKYANCKLYVTGHSLGGAIATLCAYRLASDPGWYVPITLVSIASPHVGDEKFADAFKDLETRNMIRHTRVAHTSDPIPMILSVSPYLRKVGKLGKVVGAILTYDTVMGWVIALSSKLLSGKLGSLGAYHHVGNLLSLEGPERGFDAHGIGTYITCIEAELEQLEQQHQLLYAK